MNSSEYFTDTDIPILMSATLSKPVAEADCDKVKIQRTESGFYVSRFKGPQVFHSNLSGDEIKALLNTQTASRFHAVTAQTDKETITILTSKKGKTTVLRKPLKPASGPLSNSSAGSLSQSSQGSLSPSKGPHPHSPVQNLTAAPHNRVKNYRIPEGKPVLFLQKLGVMTASGTVHAQKYDKFRQINRFLEYVDDILPVLEEAITESDGDSRTAGGGAKRPLRIIDFGCGKAYLTFALYYYLVEVRGLKADVFGLDLKTQVIADCSKLAQECGYTGLHFSTGDIAAYRQSAAADDTVDLVITLHACDTATDYALAYAVEHGARAILSVPCCQHELNTALGRTVEDQALNPLLKYGIVKERFCALATDVLRAGELEAAGYKTQLLEFIDMEGTPKNLLIRATLREKKHACNPYAELQAALGVELTLGKLLK